MWNGRSCPLPLRLILQKLILQKLILQKLILQNLILQISQQPQPPAKRQPRPQED